MVKKSSSKKSEKALNIIKKSVATPMEKSNGLENKNAPFEILKPAINTNKYTQAIAWLLIVLALLLLFNQYQFSAVVSLAGAKVAGSGLSVAAVAKAFTPSNDLDLSDVKLDGITSTAQTLARVYPLDTITTTDDAVALLIPSGVPEYGEQMGVSFDDPVGSLTVLANKIYPEYDKKVRNDPTKWQRYIDLASNPYGVSCEYCCGIGPVGISKDGRSRCGCQHNPALLGLTLWLVDNTDYNDAEILREVMRWKALFFPKNVVQLGLQLSGMKSDEIANLPGMVGGC